jgi:hypothetical protein
MFNFFNFLNTQTYITMYRLHGPEFSHTKWNYQKSAGVIRPTICYSIEFHFYFYRKAILICSHSIKNI